MIKQEYYNLLAEKDQVLKEIKTLENDKTVKKYFRLKAKVERLNAKRERVYKQMKIEEYDTCNHLFVGNNGNSYCLNCGLDTSVLDSDGKFFDVDYKIMYDYLWSKDVDTSDEIECDIDLAKAIYKKIKENNPGIDDVLLMKYFENALNDIRNIEVNEERQKNRAKRLSLNSKFNNWK